MNARTTPALPASELREALRRFRGAFVSVGAFSFCINFLMLVPAIYMLQIYDRVLNSRNATTLVMLSIITVGLFLLMAALEWVRSMTMVRMGTRFDLALNSRVFEAAFQRNLQAGNANAGQALGDLLTLRQFLTGNGLFAFFDAPWAPIYLIVIYLLHPMLGAMTLVGMLTLTALTWLTNRITREPLADAQKLSMQATNQATNHLRNAEVIESMGMLSNLRRRWFGQHARMLELQALASDRAGALSGVTKLLRLTLQSAALGVGAWYVLQNELTAGMMIAASILVGRALAPIELVIGTWRPWLGARGAYQRLGELLNAFPEREAGVSLPAPKGNVSVEGVTAAPPGTRRIVLSNLSFRIPAGEVVGVIGPSGSGKSSLARLLVGVWPTVSGVVRLDGADVFRWNKEELGPSIGYLPQDVELFDGTIAENIARFGELDSEKIVEAAQRAGVHEMILRFPEGYDTKITGMGGSLSGGQRQRIGLARALYGDPVLVVLDEPNSNLDDVGEAALVETIRDLKRRGRTVVVITHRTSVLSTIDRLLVLRDGTIAAYGPRDDVLAALRQPQAAHAAAPASAARAPTAAAGAPATAAPAAPAAEAASALAKAAGRPASIS